MQRPLDYAVNASVLALARALGRIRGERAMMLFHAHWLTIPSKKHELERSWVA